MNKCFFLFFLILTSPAFAAERVIHLVLHYKNVNFAGKCVQAIAVNNEIPGPSLHFQEGDQVTIHIDNQLEEETAMHWHGILLPWQMDGVAGITQPGIPPGKSFQYQFTLNQSGTYWYHAHAGLQEQQGAYGAFIIDPKVPSPYAYTKEYVIVLSDWSNTPPEQILANLKKEGDYYSPRFPMQSSLLHFLQEPHYLEDYKMMQQMRMSIYDINDVAYDALLLNGRTRKNPWTAPASVGDKVRLRFIGAGANTIFRVKLPDAEMKMVHVQGNDVKPYSLQDFTIAPGETYDVIVPIQQDRPHLIYVESTDKVGVIYGALITSPDQKFNVHAIPAFPTPPPVTQEMATFGMMHHDHGGHHHTMAHETSSQIEKTKYKYLTALHETNDPDKPIYQTIHMELDGWMDRFIWFINGVPEHDATPIVLVPHQRYRIIFKNASMMHHPMHMHGHWFIVRTGQGAYDPLLHTIDIPPGATIIADVDANANGQWLFHCHMLYHMMSGMSRVFQYSTILDSPSPLIKHPMAHPHGFYFSNLLEAGADPLHNVQHITFKGLYGGDYNKLMLFMNDAEINKGTTENADLDIFYWRLIDQFWALKGGINYYYRPAQTPYLQPGVGIEGMMPYFIETDLRAYYHKGSAKFDLEFERDTQITNNFFIQLGIRSLLATKTVIQDEVGSGLNQMRYIIAPYYRIKPGFNLVLEYEQERYYGVLKRLRHQEGESIRENTVTIGFSLLF